MPRFFFHVKNGVRLVTDQTGKELDDLNAARQEGTMLAREIRAEITKPAALVNELRVEIEDEVGTILDTIMLAQVAPHSD